MRDERPLLACLGGPHCLPEALNSSHWCHGSQCPAVPWDKGCPTQCWGGQGSQPGAAGCFISIKRPELAGLVILMTPVPGCEKSHRTSRLFCDFSFNVFYQQPSDGPDSPAPVHTPALRECGINNTLPCIMPFLSMIVMIKGIYLITGLLNYSSVEARLFRRVLIALLSLWHTLLSSAALLRSSELQEGWSVRGLTDDGAVRGGCQGACALIAA